MRIVRAAFAPLIVVALTACTAESDGGAGDATPTPGDGTVTVTVYDDGAPAPGVAVVFHDAAGAPVDMASTDASGEASGFAPDGGAITVARTISGERRLESILGVRTGDHLVVGFPEKRLGNAGTVRVHAPTAVANAGDYVIDAGCTDTTTTSITSPVDVAIPGECVTGESPLSVLAVSRAEDGTPYSYALAESIALDGDGAADVTLSEWSLDWGDVFLSVQDFPAGVIGARANVAAVSDGEAFYAVSVPTVLPAYEGSTATAIFPYPAQLGASYEYVVALGYGEGATVTSESVLVARDTARPQNQLLPAAGFLPPIAGAALDASRITWTFDAAHAATAAMAAFVSFEGDGAVRWSVLAPPDLAGEAALPALPDSLAEWRPQGDATSAVIAFAEADFIAGWDDARTQRGPSILETALPDGDAQMRFVLGAATIAP